MTHLAEEYVDKIHVSHNSWLLHVCIVKNNKTICFWYLSTRTTRISWLVPDACFESVVMCVFEGSHMFGGTLYCYKLAFANVVFVRAWFLGVRSVSGNTYLVFRQRVCVMKARSFCFYIYYFSWNHFRLGEMINMMSSQVVPVSCDADKAPECISDLSFVSC